MKLLTRFKPLQKWPMMPDLAGPLLVTALLWCSSSYDLTPAQIGAALILGSLPWASYRNWCRGERKEFPLFALIAGMYWLAYVLPLFWGTHEISLVTGRRTLSEKAITASICLAVIGVVALGAGMRLAERFRWATATRVDISGTPEQWHYLRIIFIVGTLVKVLIPITEFGGGGRQFISNFENMIPAVSFAIFFRYYLRGKISDFDKFLMFGYGLIALVVGISSGWLGSFVGFGIIAMTVYSYERGKLPLTAALIVLPVILFFQPGKEAFRVRYWRGSSTDGYFERTSFWVENSWNAWADAVTDQTGKRGRKLADVTLSRLSLLQQTANVMEFTPGRVPYQHGRLYSYIGVTLIPRVLWPDKPSVNDANHWYQVSYGLTYRGEIARVSIAVGTVAESYINFGWLGPVLIIFPLGFFLGSLQRFFLRTDSGLLFCSVGAVLVPQLLAVESQMAELVAGLAQQVFVVLLVLVPILKSRGRETRVPVRMFAPPASQPKIFSSNTSLQKPPL
jgi:hypothetical protein